MRNTIKTLLEHLLSYKKNVTKGKNVFIGMFSDLTNVHIGNFTYISGRAKLLNLKIGSYTSIAKGLKTGFGSHPTKRFSTSPVFHSINNVFKKKYIKETSFNSNIDTTYIGNDVWIGLNVILMDGVNIGDGSIIAAGSVVNKDVPPYSIVGGVPAKLIKMRFDSETINILQDSEWWKKEPKEIIDILGDLVELELDNKNNKLLLKKIQW
jgi:acetyltransferase-like isoleucine patch superfamily enzyme